MFRTQTAWATAAALGGLISGALFSTPMVTAQSLDTPMTRLRPIGAPSAVDRYRPVSETRSFRETAYQQAASPATGSGTQAAFATSPVRQAVMLQQFEAPGLPGGSSGPGATGGTNGMTLPGGFGTTPPATMPPAGTLPSPPMTTLPGNLMPVPQSSPIPSNSDYAPLAAPQLGSGFATIDNCNCITAPSSYIAASTTVGCSPVSYQGPTTYQGPAVSTVPSTQIAAPAILPSGFARPRQGIPPGPLISFGQQLNPVQVGQGILGQPVAYVPGQPIRNWIRYFFP